ncbi:MAG: hypothetical protein U0R76_06900 [Candidatus Nanopelagicales bacterium]
MSRTTRRRAIRAVAPVAGLLAAGLLVWQGSYAAFSATTTSPNNNWTTGTVALTNSSNAFASPTGVATWAAANNLKPGDTDTKCITVKSSGSLAGAVRLYVANVSAANALTNNLKFTVKVMTGVAANTVNSTNCNGFVATSTLTTNTALSSLPTSFGAPGLGGWSVTGTGPATPEYAAYQIQYTLDAATTPSNATGLTGSADFVWEVQA